MRWFWFLLLVLVVGSSFIHVCAQVPKARAEFEKTTFDFGQVKESGGPVSYEFKFANKGNAPLYIGNVTASCGCTTPYWTSDTIFPGKSGTIKALFDPFNRPGPFSKTLTVTTNADPVLYLLTISGNVVPRPKSSSDIYPDRLGSLRMVSRYMHLGDITNEKPVKREFELLNEGNAPVLFTEPVITPAFIKIKVEPKEIKQGEKASIKIEYDATLKNDFGYVYDPVELVTNDPSENKKQLIISASIKPYFPVLSSEELSVAPKIQFERISHDFGVIKQGEKVSTAFVFTNTGKKNLVIYKTKATCGCTAGEPDKKLLKPGETSQISVVFDSFGKEGNQEKQINVYCNDPSNPNPVLTIKSVVKK